MRSLSPDEQALWERVTATLRPLSRERVAARPIEARPVEAPVVARLRGRVPPARPTPTAPRSARPLHDATLDGSWDRRLQSGTIEPDRVIDLHGLNLDAAWSAIDTALDRAIAAGDRVLLLVTGHHRPGDPPIVRGKIRAAVHDWLAASPHAGRIAAVRAAHRRHGGGGSLYIILRRR